MIHSMLTFLAVVLSAAVVASAQKSHTAHEDPELEIAHDVVFSMGTSFIPSAFNAESNDFSLVMAPSIGFGYTAMLSKHFGLATKNDVEFVNVEVRGKKFGEDPNDRIERENVLILTGGGLWSPLPRFAFYAGAGVELDKNETLATLTGTVEYVVFTKEEEDSEWAAVVEATYHWKETYSSFSIGIAIGYGWW